MPTKDVPTKKRNRRNTKPKTKCKKKPVVRRRRRRATRGTSPPQPITPPLAATTPAPLLQTSPQPPAISPTPNSTTTSETPLVSPTLAVQRGLPCHPFSRSFSLFLQQEIANLPLQDSDRNIRARDIMQCLIVARRVGANEVEKFVSELLGSKSPVELIEACIDLIIPDEDLQLASKPGADDILTILASRLPPTFDILLAKDSINRLWTYSMPLSNELLAKIVRSRKQRSSDCLAVIAALERSPPDITISAMGKSFPCHIVLLSMFWPLHRRFCTPNTQNVELGNLLIPDAVKYLIEFFKSGATSHFDQYCAQSILANAKELGFVDSKTGEAFPAFAELIEHLKSNQGRSTIHNCFYALAAAMEAKNIQDWDECLKALRTGDYEAVCNSESAQWLYDKCSIAHWSLTWFLFSGKTEYPFKAENPFQLLGEFKPPR